MSDEASMRAGDIVGGWRMLPVRDFDEIAPGNSLILAPHPDDESLGCGGLIAEAATRSRSPIVVCVTDGAASHPGSTAFPPERLAAVRAAELRVACAVLGLEADRVISLELPDGRAPVAGPSFEEAVARIAQLIRDNDIATVFASWQHDPHCDHTAVALLARHAADLAGARLRFYPVWGWLLPEDCTVPCERPRGARLDITRHVAAKRRAIAAHVSQYGEMIPDAPSGFRLPPALLRMTDSPYEVFLDP